MDIKSRILSSEKNKMMHAIGELYMCIIFSLLLILPDLHSDTKRRGGTPLWNASLPYLDSGSSRNYSRYVIRSHPGPSWRQPP